MHRVDADQVAVAWREVTQRVTAERELWATLEQLCEREALHRTVLDALDEAVVLYLADGSVAMTNYAARALFGVGGSRQQIAAELHALRVEDADGVPVPVEERPVATTFRTGLPQMGAVHRVRRTDGTSAWMSTTTIPLRSDPKAPLHGVVATSMDISLQRVFEAERDRRDAEMRLMNLKLRQAQAVRDQMVAVASHELRTPLTAIVGYAGLLLDDDSDADGGTDPRDLLTDEERRDSLGRIALAARRLERLVDDLLVISSLEAGGLRLDLADHALPDLLRETLDTHPRGAEVTVTGGRDIRLHADAGRVAQILGNLLTNAFKYGAAPVAIRVDADTDLVELRVIDAGPGVPAGMESTVFGQFEQARPGSDGVGLGLWIVRALAEAHGGSAAYEAGVPHGACFVVRLPLTGPGDGQAGP
jgi:signal transduction histidine kinase